MREIQDFLEADCPLTKPTLGMFLGVYNATNGDPCRTGCAYFRGGQCPSFKVLFPGITVPTPKTTKKVDGAASGYVPPSKKPFKW